MAAARPPTRLAEHDTALHSLLESLLTEVPSGPSNAVVAANPLRNAAWWDIEKQVPSWEIR